ncbi:penicillin-binding protein 1C [Flavobacterium psychrophilum]|uniref:penicillin-binding protein 1C n=1 Tax=Flavobacterium psychrophilum TaxID=96345 RepID=UPI000B7C0BF2|nr:penicillin-binding protein 1C [Flavobacterium psychrophilum]EKT4549730.1 penicillin-binding protein 1C [Flavobacterium psychrophilum]ELV7525712.1 penicillin-binding protein 1C [Flavobacterium psychrophilum]ELY2010766.1 penicillin-binding protein 1C [Flavobacterium psychrophilum]SNA78299.1 Membrane carboxypeptidase/penicillin-binding protein PbpC [Flavobacterium psychrophilum]
MKAKITAFLQRIINTIKRNKIKSSIAFILLMVYYFSLPSTLFQEPYSTVIESKEGELLGAKIAHDGQWRFPAQDSVPYKFKKCIVYFEDEYFYKHPGFNPVAMVNAIKQNQKAGKVVRGGSTLTQQVIRLSRKGKNRTYFEKVIEIILATRLELRHCKDKILELYAAHAPFGGNVVGLEMASWRYFGVQSHQLSWAESATLAVLPNAPSLIYPGKNQQKLLKKRNNLLLKLKTEGVIDAQTYELAIDEPLPQKPYDLPQIAPHLLQRVAKNKEGTRLKTTVDIALQNRINQIAKYYYNQYKQNEVNNLAIIVIDIKTRNIISYVGNSPTDLNHQKDVDIIEAPRSTGSILKPLLYAEMLDEGELLPNTLVADIPTQISGYTPQNFNLTFDGAVPAHRALSRSLNIPSVLMLQDFGVNKFYEELQRFKLRDISKSPDHYGLSLILGGAESNLWDLCRTYAGLSSTIDYFNKNNGNYRTKEFVELNYDHNFTPDFGYDSKQKTILGAGAIWQTYNAMEEVNRPEGDEAWKFYDSSLKIAWKTGTSFGNRDAWAIGTNARYVVGVWVGNASGEGRPTLTGVTSAAPILFDVFNLLPRQKWFGMPLLDLTEVEVCKLSGHLAQEDCPKIKQLVSLKGKTTSICPYHKTVHLDKTGKYRVNSSCENVENIMTKKWFVLPPVMEWYYKNQHVDYLPLPPYRSDCAGTLTPSMDFIYPKTNSKIYLTKNFNSEIQPVILKIAHSNRETEVYWYIDNVYKGSTKTFHEMPITPTQGFHYITVIDESGYEIRKKIEIVRD